MTHEEQILVIQKVAQNHRNKCFGFFTKEDIEQEVWIIALQKKSEFKPTRGKQKDELKSFEHWLNRVVSNRLKNLYRDKYVVPQQLHKEKPNNLLSPVSLDKVEEKSRSINLNFLIENKEIQKYLMDNLDHLDLLVFDALLSGETITSYYKTKLYNKITSLLNEFKKR